mmetsp:Transcript_19014/g.54208  ORF Transcript_19014/g.54208 Transcript_19014/m.54208 type:complete len:568 (-) Transcript_19014:262-1965(-)
MWRVGPLAVAVSTAAGLSTDVQCMQPAAPPGCAGPKTPNEFINTLLSPSVYDKSQRPSCDGKSPTVVEAQFDLLRVGNIDQKLGIVPLSGFFKAWWKDPRLEFNGTSSGGCFDVVTLSSAEVARWLWTPDLYIDNLIERRRDATASSAVVTPDGTVAMTERVTLHVKSPLDLGKIPYDRHTATILMGSYSQDITRLRLTARGGTIGVGRSGVGISAERVSSSQWEFDGDGTFDTPGHVEVVDSLGMSFDMLSLIFDFAREPKFYLEQTIRPAILFTIVSYIQFWVDPTLAPARAALAVIPVLIMRTMFSSVYSSLPQGSQNMWLSDFLFTINLMVALGAVEFALIQHLCQVEKRRAARLQNLSSARSTAERLFSEADMQGMPLLDFLNSRYSCKSRSTVGQMRCTLSEGQHSNFEVKEVDFAFIQFAKDVFSHMSRTEENLINASELRKSLRTFNIYISLPRTLHAMGMFLRDIGQETPLDEVEITFSLAHFTKLLLVIDKYSLASASARRKTCTGAGIVHLFQSVSPSRTVDILARIVFPIAYIFVTIFYYAFLGTWKLDRVTYDS